MLPSDPWDSSSSGEPASSSREGVHSASVSPISIDRLAVLLSPSQRPDDLARDIHLNEIVVQACVATGATGAAIALARGDEFICRASTGNTAPDLGVRLNIDQGLSAFCVHTGEVQRCDDSEHDARVDAEVCRHLGVRSVLVVPIVYGEFLLGIFEIFSPEPFAFFDRDIQTVVTLSRRVLAALGILTPVEAPPQAGSFQNSPRPPEEVPNPAIAETKVLRSVELKEAPPKIVKLAKSEVAVSAPKPEITAPAARPPTTSEPSYPQFKIVQKPRRDYLTGILTVMVVAFALLLGWMLGHGHLARRDAAREELQSAVEAQQKARQPEVPAEDHSDRAQTREVESTIPAEAKPAAPPARSPFASKRDAGKPSDDDLVVYQDGKIIYRQGASPSKSTRSGNQPTATASENPVELSPEVAGALLTVRVEPTYPDRARLQNIQGPVILQAFVNEDGSVQQLKVLNGNADLAVAAIDAVRRWRFKPYALKGKPSPFATRITVNFALPGAPPEASN